MRKRSSHWRVYRLENRVAPNATPVGPLVRPYTFTEVMASIRGDDPLEKLADLGINAINIGSSQVILRQNDAALLKIALQPQTDPLEVIAKMRQHPGVEWTQPNYIAVGDPREFTPNDPSYSTQYHHPLMQANKAWDTQTGNPAVVVAVTDDGLAWSHPDLAANVWINNKEIGGNGKDDDGNGFIDDIRGWDFSAGDNNPNPGGDFTHGTHVAGIIAARTNNGVGVSGVAGGGLNGNGIRLMPIRWYGTAAWTSAIIAQSYAYAADNGAKIINSSYNFDNFVNNGVADVVVQAAFDYAYSKGLLIFHSAGNDNAADPPRRVFDQALYVANTDANDVRGSSSNYGSFVDVAAPGVSILSTTTKADGTVFEYAALSGTSMATPNAAGVAALIWSQHPTWTRDQVAAQLLGTANNIDATNPNFIGQLGTGRANAHRGVTEVLPPPKFAGIVGLPAVNASTARLPMTFTLNVPMRLDPSTVIGKNFDLRGDGPDDQFGTADDVVIPLTINHGSAYRIGMSELTFENASIGPVDRYRFTASTKLQDPFGQSLDGNGDGVGGDDFVHIFFVHRQIDGFVYEDRDVDGDRDGNDPPSFARAVYLDVNQNGQLDATNVPFAATDLPRSLPDNQTTSATLSLNGFVGAVTDLNVEISISHVYVGDLIAKLIGPTGATIDLFHRVGGSDDNFTNTVFDDQALVSINEAAAPFTGAFRPAGSLADFVGLEPNGVWTLQISDVVASFSGSLVAWSLQVTTSEPMAYTDATGLYGLNGISPGDYTLREVMPAAWNTGSQPASGKYAVTINNNTALNHDFSELRGNAIYGRFYDDANHSGIMESTDPPLGGWTAYLDANNNQQLDTAQTAVVSTNVPLAIPDNSFTTSTVSINGSVGPVADVNVTLSINHFNDQQLDVYLISPTGHKVELFSDVGAGGDHFTNTTLDDQATISITAGAAPFTGTFRPEGRLSDFVGLLADGVWTLQVVDDTVNVTGTLLNWSIQVSSAERSAVSDTDGIYTIINVPAGSHSLRRVLQSGFSTTQPITPAYAVAMTTGQTVTDRDFGQTQAPVPPPPRIESVQVDDGSGQRSLVRQLTVTFDQVVTLPIDSASAFTVTGTGGATPFAVDLANNTPTKTVARLTFANGLGDGNYSVTVLANLVHNLSGQALDGDGNGMAGGNFTSLFHRLFGDADGNRTINSTDFAALRSVFANGPSIFDNNLDGQTNATDFAAFRARFGVTI